MIDLSTWNLSIPEGTPALTIATPVLVKGFKDAYFHSDTGTLFFWAPVTGSKTANAIYPRSELRETNANGTVHNWTYGAADNYLRASLMINQVPSTGKIVIGQIHVFNSNEPMLKVEYQYKEKTADGNVVAKLRLSPADADAAVITIASGVKLNTRFPYIIHLAKDGTLSVTVADKTYVVKIDTKWSTAAFYYKAGAYVQDNTGYATEGGAVTFYNLAITHTP
ncbi:polysaccharide lyase family 7 protein [Pseudomonas sp. dw_358]|uniref:polysaccharide lyase family 7 protein n=1 Tax=Pseudomonas sp. dw_358 TaxID=2720083 RepID=UPI001BD531E8|nr:polysaccharide lyase family 7 protein [Pseudomonas sp. dw_358]